MSVLMRLSMLKAQGIGTNLIAREVALDFGGGVFRPQIVTHTPGLTNVTCDTPYRWYQPSKKRSLPLALYDVTEVFSAGQSYALVSHTPT